MMETNEDKNKTGSKEEQRRVLVEPLARRIADMKMEGPALFFLEAMRPLSFIGSQAMIFLEPLVRIFYPSKRYREYAEFFESRENVKFLIREIEARAESRRKDRADT